MAINTSEPHYTFLLTPRKRDIRPVGVVGTESPWHLVWRRDLERGHRVKRGDTRRGKEIGVPHVQIMFHQESVCTGQKDSIMPVTAKAHLQVTPRVIFLSGGNQRKFCNPSPLVLSCATACLPQPGSGFVFNMSQIFSG